MLERTRRKFRTLFRLVLVRVTLLLATATLSACATNPATGRSQLALFDVSPSEEIALGQKTFPKALQQMGGAYPDAALEEYVQSVGERLARVGHRPELPYQFRVVNDSTPNAFALPGGPIAITRGLLVYLESEAQLAAVLGHEVAHITARHAVQGMQRGALFDLAVSVVSGVTAQADYGPLALKASQAAAGLLDRSYSREQESESDVLGIDYMARAGYSPLGAIELQEIFYRKIEGGASGDWLSGLFRTHPFSRDRLEANRLYVRQNYVEASGRKGQEAFAAATRRLQQTRPAYALYDQARALEAKGELVAAIETYQQALSAAPQEALINAGLGLAYLRQDDLVPARRHLQQAVKLDDQYFQTHLGLGYVALKRKEYPQSIASLEKSNSLLTTLEGAFLLAQAYEGGGRVGDAVPLYQAVAQADPQGRMGQEAQARLKALGSL